MKTAAYTRSLTILLALLLSSVLVLAQESKEDKFYSNDQGHWIVEVPLWVPGFRGQLAYGNYNLNSSANKDEREFKKLYSDVGLQFYFVGRIAAQYKNIRIQADAFSGRVGSAFKYTSIIGSMEKELVYIEIQGTIPRLILGYSVWNMLTDNDFKIELVPYAGIRYLSISLQSEVFDSTEIIDHRQSRFDPILGFYVPVSYKRFKMEWQLDYGYAGRGSSWVISNRYRYRISKLIDVQLGWNLLGSKYNGELANNKLEASIRLFGPTAGIGFSF